MAEESQSNSPTVLRSINWREVFPFTNIFRGFRIAVHPSKLVLGLLALLSLYLGGRVMDAIWPTGSLANPGEIAAYQSFVDATPKADFSEKIKKDREGMEARYGSILRQAGILTDDAAIKEAAKKFARRSELESKRMWIANTAIEEAAKAKTKAIEEANKLDTEKKKKGIEDAEAAYKKAFLENKSEAGSDIAQLRRVVPEGIFKAFFEYEVQQVNGVAYAVWQNEWLAKGGVKDCVVNFFSVGPVWLWKYHTVYAVIFTVLFLLVWAVFGGAISRIAAVHVARDEKISVRQALRFSLNKVLSFIFAPVIPLVIVAIIGLVIAVGGLLLYIPVAGPIVVGAMFFLALTASVVITLVLFGTIGGFGLMYPTIAVEGSDSFDAISRSFSYVFARPWRMVFYTAVAIGYGAFTYLFVRFFVWIVLLVTHTFAGLFLSGAESGGTAYWFSQMWPEPGTFFSFKLPYEVNYAGLAWSESVASFLISFWVYLLIALVGAYAISYFLSVSTILYALMRHEVDATEMEDVYVEEMEDDLADIAPATPAAAPAASTFSPATIQGTTADVKPPEGQA
ncbi:DUF1542 domain-containing protein [Humisphaera borealis]|uniref:DUF1542 domain-containing protein n=1 Tax=Humisphaera borealis TaxID=2807512 RepID=A0A7M2WPN1_9BACT|nr:DUF1542 domain-containing protein [Humisphaera borealis]QOV87428.1 DUF1542 domain-containing protein [Humisphaera borealis]